MTAPAAVWLARLRHDLVKRMVWPARDRRDLGGAVAPGGLTPQLVDDEGRPVSARALWAALAAAAPAGLDTAGFAQAIERAIVAAEAGDVEGVLALESAFDDLAARVRRLASSLDGER